MKIIIINLCIRFVAEEWIITLIGPCSMVNDAMSTEWISRNTIS